MPTRSRSRLSRCAIALLVVAPATWFAVAWGTRSSPSGATTSDVPASPGRSSRTRRGEPRVRLADIPAQAVSRSDADAVPGSRSNGEEPDLRASLEVALRTGTAADLAHARRLAEVGSGEEAVPDDLVRALMRATPHEEAVEGKRSWLVDRRALVTWIIDGWSPPEASAFLADAVRARADSLSLFAAEAARRCRGYRADESLVHALLDHPAAGLREAGIELVRSQPDDVVMGLSGRLRAISDEEARAAAARALATAVVTRPRLSDREALVRQLLDMAAGDPAYSCRVVALQGLRSIAEQPYRVSANDALAFVADAALEWPERVTAWELVVLTRGMRLVESPALDSIDDALQALEAIDWGRHGEACQEALGTMLRRMPESATFDADLLVRLLRRSAEHDQTLVAHLAAAPDSPRSVRTIAEDALASTDR